MTGWRARLSRWLVIFSTLVLVIIPQVANAATLNELLRQKADLQKQSEENRKKAEAKKRESASLQNLIGDLDGDISYTSNRISNTQNRINLTEKIITDLNGKIGQTEAELTKFNDQLRIAYITLYELAQTSTAEMLLQEDSLSDMVSRAQYLEAIQTSLIDKVKQATAIKDDLSEQKKNNETQQADLQGLRKELESSKAQLAGQRAEKDSLLHETKGEQVKYEELLKKLAADQEKIDRQIYEARRKSAGKGEQIIYGGSSYPWGNESNPAAVDPWFFYKRQCVSYTAWKFQSTYGKTFTNTRPGQGSAWNWPNLARDQGYTVSSTPRVGAVVSWPIGQNRPYGHTAWVEAVNPDGTINVSEYNWVVERGYSERRNVNPYQYGTPSYITP